MEQLKQDLDHILMDLIQRARKHGSARYINDMLDLKLDIVKNDVVFDMNGEIHHFNALRLLNLRAYTKTLRLNVEDYLSHLDKQSAKTDVDLMWYMHATHAVRHLVESLKSLVK
ncbi:hypothetical protein [Vibrio phage VP4B]|uniref:Uncharacterized protein n=1 Tax=Vibrio phage VP4B TaxID=1262540 RepID=V9M016_9CAUD|nr:hypothetical protein FDJ61_gp062 [Vibrio phage VP4B]AGB07176.1 hypothetical protein [Vibrio phage VP4B]